MPKSFSRRFVALPLAAMLVANTPGDPMQPTSAALQERQERELVQAGERWRELYEAGDWEALRTLYTDDAVLMTQGQPRIQGADKIIAFLQRLPAAGAAVTFRFLPEEVEMVSGEGGANLGFVTAKYRMDIAFPQSEPAIVAGRSLLIYKWQDGAWKLWRDIDNLAPDVTAADFETDR